MRSVTRADNLFGEEGAKALCPQLAGMSNLHTLNLARTCCGLVVALDEEVCAMYV